MALIPPSTPPLDASGYFAREWVAYFQALADQLARIEARLAAASIP